MTPGGYHGRDCMVVRFTTTCALSAYRHLSCEYDPHGEVYLIQQYVIKVCQRLTTGCWFSPCTPVSSTNKTDRHNITEILLKVALNTINHANHMTPAFGSPLVLPLLHQINITVVREITYCFNQYYNYVLITTLIR